MIESDSTAMQAVVRQWLAEAVRKENGVAVLTGAGVSAESGVPTFRDGGTGYWARFRPEDMASEAGYRRDPQHVWRWYQHRRELVRHAQPNAGHMALAQWAQRHPARLTLITQNVDDLHQRAGSTGVLCLHGELLKSRWLNHRCAHCDLEHTTAGEPPSCPACGNLLRPAVVWFGEPLPQDVWSEAEHAAQHCELMLVVGTSGAVYPAAGLAQIARQGGARVVVINPQQTELDPVAHVLLHGASASLLPALLRDNAANA